MTRLLHVDSAEEVGRRVRDRREALGLAQREIATPAEGGCTHAHVSRIEKGVRTPSGKVLDYLAEKLEVDAAWLARGDQAPYLVEVDRSLIEAALGQEGLGLLELTVKERGMLELEMARWAEAALQAVALTIGNERRRAAEVSRLEDAGFVFWGGEWIHRDHDEWGQMGHEQALLRLVDQEVVA